MTIGGGSIIDFNFSKAWGVNPAAATGTIVVDTSAGGGSEAALAVGDYVTYSFGSVASFPGVVTDVGSSQEFGSGRKQTFQVVDNRIRLGWQTVFGAWNIEDDIYAKGDARPTTPSTGSSSSSNGDDTVHVQGAASTFVEFINPSTVAADPASSDSWAGRRRFRHLLPQHWESGTWTYSDSPLTVSQILNSAFNHAWGDYGFNRSYDASMSTAVILGIDYQTGTKLSNLISEINSKLGLDMMISGSRNLTWARKGTGLKPVADSTATTISSGTSLTSVDTYIRVIGERMQIQQINVELEPDWNRNFDPYIDELAWFREVALRFDMPTDTKAQCADVAAFAREVTVADFANQVNHRFLDSRPYGKISRNRLPVWVYIREFVYRAYRIPLDYVCHGVPLASLDIADGLLAATDITGDGEEGHQIYAFTPVEYYPPVQAQAICKGQPLDLINARDIRMFYRGATKDLSHEWTTAPPFEVGVVSKSIRFHVPTFIDGDPAAGKSIYLLPNRGEGGGTDATSDVSESSDLLDIAIPNPDFEIEPAAVKCSFTFLMGRYYRDYGGGPRRGTSHAAGLDIHLLDCTLDDVLLDDGVRVMASEDVRVPDSAASMFQEVLYYDGGGAQEKADAIASSLLSLSPTQDSGGFTRHGVAGTALTPAIDRVSVVINFNEAITERVDYTKARATSAPLAERTLQRIQRSEELYSGQEALKREIREYRLIAGQLRGIKIDPRAREHVAFNDVFEKPVGSEGGASTFVMDNLSIGFKSGEIVWLDDAGVPCEKGGSFGGIAVADTKGKGLYIAHTGRVPVRVAGPIVVGGLVMADPGSKTGGAVGSVAIGRLTHGVSVSEYSTDILVQLDISVPSPDCRFRVTFDYDKQRLYVGPGSAAVVEATIVSYSGMADPPRPVVPLDPVLDGKALSETAFWEVGGKEIGEVYQVICKYSGGHAGMFLQKISEDMVLTDKECAWVIAKLTFSGESGKFTVDRIDQCWWSDVFHDFSSPPVSTDTSTTTTTDETSHGDGPNLPTIPQQAAEVGTFWPLFRTISEGDSITYKVRVTHGFIEDHITGEGAAQASYPCHNQYIDPPSNTKLVEFDVESGDYISVFVPVTKKGALRNPYGDGVNGVPGGLIVVGGDYSGASVHYIPPVGDGWDGGAEGSYYYPLAKFEVDAEGAFKITYILAGDNIQHFRDLPMFKKASDDGEDVFHCYNQETTTYETYGLIGALPNGHVADTTPVGWTDKTYPVILKKEDHKIKFSVKVPQPTIIPNGGGGGWTPDGPDFNFMGNSVQASWHTGVGEEAPYVRVNPVENETVLYIRGGVFRTKAQADAIDAAKAAAMHPVVPAPMQIKHYISQIAGDGSGGNASGSPDANGPATLVQLGQGWDMPF